MANKQALTILVILELVDSDSEEEKLDEERHGNGLREEKNWVTNIYQHSTRITNGIYGCLQGNDENELQKF